MAEPVSVSDVEIALRLYELRREPVMRQARDFVVFRYFPQSLEDYLAIANAPHLAENAYLRQVVSYWEMAASFVVRGILHPDVFLDTCGEGILVFAKFQPLLQAIREKRDASFLRTLEAAITGRPALEAEVRALQPWLARRGQAPPRA